MFLKLLLLLRASSCLTYAVFILILLCQGRLGRSPDVSRSGRSGALVCGRHRFVGRQVRPPEAARCLRERAPVRAVDSAADAALLKVLAPIA